MRAENFGGESYLQSFFVKLKHRFHGAVIIRKSFEEFYNFVMVETFDSLEK